MFDGQEWQSVEQCFQGLKFLDRAVRERIRAIRKEPEDSDASHGVRVWQAGQVHSEIRPDWEATKVEIIYRVTFAKYAQNPDLQDHLLSTVPAEIVGGPSTSWTTRSGQQTNWGEWNGQIQMLVREMLRSPTDHKASQILLAGFDEYMTVQGGNVFPLPGYVASESPASLTEAAAKCFLETCANARCVDSRGTQWQVWASDDAKKVAASLLSVGIDDGRYSGLVAGCFEQLLTAEGGISADTLHGCLAEYSEEIVEDLALDNPKLIGMMSRIRAALASAE